MVAGGTRRNSLRHYDDVPASLVDVFHIYRDVIGHISDSDFGGEWFCYPVVCIDKLDCCGTETAWTERHQEELTGILMRFEDYRQLREPSRLDLPTDGSIKRGHSVWHSMASSTLIS